MKQELEKKLQWLTYTGYEAGARFSKLEFREERIEAIRSIIRSRLEMRKTINEKTPSSYYLKHCVESQVEALGDPLNGYVSNGEFIYAMILEGYDVEVDGRNAYFNLATRSLKRLPRVPCYDEKGNVYEFSNVGLYRRRVRPAFRINIEEYRDLIEERDLWWAYHEDEDEEDVE